MDIYDLAATWDWATIWAVVLVVTLVLFAVLAVVVTIGGFKDVLAMFRELDAQHEQPDLPDEANEN
jgi:hypothetical protein